MNYRQFGNTDMKVSEIGFGAWAIGGNAMVGDTAIGWGSSDDTVSRRAIKTSVDNGINFFDTADIYGLGHSEELLGETLSGNQNVIIATKVGNVSRSNKFTTDYSMEYILDACEKSLKRLKRDRIDYYQLHTAKLINLQDGDCVEAMQLLQQQGKIRFWGISLNTFDPGPEAAFMLSHHIGNGFQLVLNIINQRSLVMLKTAGAMGYGIIARMPLQFGILTGKFNTEQIFPEDDHRHKRVTKDIISRCNEELEIVWKLCKKYDIEKSQLALSYVLSYPQVSTVIPGIRTPEHAIENTKSFTQLDKEDMAMIEMFGRVQSQELMEMIQNRG